MPFIVAWILLGCHFFFGMVTCSAILDLAWKKGRYCSFHLLLSGDGKIRLTRKVTVRDLLFIILQLPS